MRSLAVYLKNYKKESVLAPFFKFLEVIFDLLVPVVIARIIDIGIAGNDRSFILQNFFLLILMAAAGLTVSITAQYFAAKASVGFAAQLRQAVFDHVQKFSYAELDQIGTPTLITRLTNDINQVQNGLNMGLRLLLRSPFIVLGSMVMAFTINLRCALIFVVAIPLLFLVVFVIMYLSIPLFRKVQGRLDRVTALTRENLTGVRVIRAFCREKEAVKEFDDCNQELTRLNEFVGKLSALLNPVTYVLINIATVFLISTAGIQVNIGGMQQGQAVALYNYMAQMIVELIKLASLIITLNKAAACADRVADVLNVAPSMHYKEETEIADKADSVVSFDHVTFSYPDTGAPSLSDICFSVRQGQSVGIIGSTGSGKSTLVNLIARFYDATSGSVLIDGQDIQNFSRSDLRLKIGVVPQKAALFRGTIRDNLKWGNEAASDEEIWQALSIAQAKEVVEQKEGQLDHMIEQSGKNLSGGQKQRLTIARALVKQPEILILDDSASALDFATDAALRKSLSTLKGKTTSFLVSQRASSIRQCDLILVLDDGCLAGKGTHQELVNTCETYREIFFSQFPEERILYERLHPQTPDSEKDKEGTL